LARTLSFLPLTSTLISRNFPFTSKGSDLFAILPRWPGRNLRRKNVTGVKSVTLLGSTAPLKFKAAKGGVQRSSLSVPAQEED